MGFPNPLSSGGVARPAQEMQNQQAATHSPTCHLSHLEPPSRSPQLLSPPLDGGIEQHAFPSHSFTDPFPACFSASSLPPENRSWGFYLLDVQGSQCQMKAHCLSNEAT